MGQSSYQSPKFEPELIKLIRHRIWPEALLKIVLQYRKASYRDSQGYTALHWACVQDPPVDVVRALLVAYPEATSIRNRWGKTPLHVACKYDNASVDVIRELVKADIYSVAERDNDGRTPLSLLCCDLSAFFNAINLASPSNKTPSDIITQYDTLKDFWEKACILIKAAYYGSIEKPQMNGGKCNIIHACAGIGDCPIDVLRLAIKLHPEQLEETDQHGNLPLHISSALLTTSRRLFNTYAFFIAASPVAAKIRNHKGKLPLHLIIEGDQEWENGVACILDAYPDAISARDQESGLYPFMLAAVGGSASLSIIYHLLTFCPELERFSGPQSQHAA